MYISITAPVAAPGLAGYRFGAPFPTPVRLDRSRGVRARRLSGMGATPAQIATGVIAGTNIGASTAIGTGSEVAGGIAAGLETVAPFTGPAAPFVAALGAIVGPIASLFKGCGVTCQKTTQIANQVAAAAGQITAAYWAQPVRTASMQAAAVSSLQQLYSYLIQNCQAIGGQGGQQCIADRQPGGKYDFQAQQIAPIQNDSAVVPDPSPVTAAATSLGLPASVTGSSLFVPLAIALGAWLLLK
jgi:hypothetical protein